MHVRVWYNICFARSYLFTFFADERMHAAIATLLLSFASNPWSPGRWRVDLDITYDPEEANEGGRLVLPTIVSIESDKAVEEDDTGKCDRLSIVKNPTFITNDGEQTVGLRSDGGWRISTRRSANKGTAGQLFLWMDVLESATRQGVTLEANQRLYLTANCWRTTEFNVGLKKFDPLLRDYEAAQSRLELKLSHENGDRRLDGTDLIDTALASMDMAILVKKRDDCLRDVLNAELTLPNRRKVSSEGHWPGSDEQLTISNGLIIGKSLERGWFGLGGPKEAVIGKWRAIPIYTENEEGDFELAAKTNAEDFDREDDSDYESEELEVNAK